MNRRNTDAFFAFLGMLVFTFVIPVGLIYGHDLGHLTRGVTEVLSLGSCAMGLLCVICSE